MLSKEKIKKITPNIILNFYRKYVPFFAPVSYSQCGEDLIVGFILSQITTSKSINYCDIGANAPWKFSNTAKFYLKNKRNHTGVLVEPDPVLASILKRKRSKDIVVNKGVKSGEESANVLEFYQMSSNTLNTFSYKEAQYYETLGYQINNKLDIEVIDINELLVQYFDNKVIHFLSVDVEGLDYEILKTMDFEKFRPVCICVETINFVPNGMAIKDNKIVDLLVNNGYFEYAFTGINSIFVDRDRWVNR